VHYPEVATARSEGGIVRLQFREPLEVCGPSVFELAGPDAGFHAASAELGSEVGEVLVRCAEVETPSRLRYGWGAAAAASLRSTESGLPVAQFFLSIP
jgi:hypothetical protein